MGEGVAAGLIEQRIGEEPSQTDIAWPRCPGRSNRPRQAPPPGLGRGWWRPYLFWRRCERRGRAIGCHWVPLGAIGQAPLDTKSPAHQHAGHAGGTAGAAPRRVRLAPSCYCIVKQQTRPKGSTRQVPTRRERGGVG